MSSGRLAALCAVGVALCALGAGCGRGPAQGVAPPGPAASGEAAVQVVVCIGPQAYFVKRIAGDLATVETLVAPGQSPHSYEPSPRQVAALETADLYLRIGLPFEDTLLAKALASRPALPVADMRDGIPLRKMEGHAHEHAHGDHEGHAPAEAHEPTEVEVDPHTWMAPKLAMRQAETVRDALIRVDGAHEAQYREGCAGLTRDLEEVDREIAEALAPLRGKPMLVFHPAFGYFADAYGLRQIAIETEGKEPSARELTGLIARAKENGVRVVFVQKQFPGGAAEAVAEAIGGAVVPLDDLAEDYLANLRAIARAVREGVGDGGA